MVVVAHSDDEAIAMGGTIRKHANLGDKVAVVSMTNGVGARVGTTNNQIQNRKLAAELSSRVLGFNWCNWYDFADNAMDSYPLLDVVRCIEEVKATCQPEIVYTHSSADLNIDHRVVANATLTAFRPHPRELCQEIRLFEVASATDFGHPALTGRFTPNLFVSVENEWNAKKMALNGYDDEMRDYPHSRSIESIKNLAKVRGNQVGMRLAEAFEVVRKIER